MVILLLMLTLSGPQATDQFGKTYSPESPGEGLTVIDFAASWCKPCWKALPHIQALADRGEVRVLVISQDETEAGRNRLVKKLGLKMPVIWDRGHHWAEFYQPQGMPTTMIVDAQGKVRYASVGFSEASWQKFQSQLKALLAE